MKIYGLIIIMILMMSGKLLGVDCFQSADFWKIIKGTHSSYGTGWENDDDNYSGGEGPVYENDNAAIDIEDTYEIELETDQDGAF